MLIYMEKSINERIGIVMEYYGLNPNSMANKMGTSNVNIRNYIGGRVPSYDFIYNLLQTFVNINPSWFVMGKGEMLLQSATNFNNSNDLIKEKDKRISNLEAQVLNLQEIIQKLLNGGVTKESKVDEGNTG